MQIHKFGGASTNSVERIRNVRSIVSSLPLGKKLIVVSALGKTTNALEKVVQFSVNGEKEKAMEELNRIRTQHLNMGSELFGSHKECLEGLNAFFDEATENLKGLSNKNYNKSYDSMVHFGELFSSFMVSSFLNIKGVRNVWLDVRKVLKTNDHFREAGILWDVCKPLIRDEIDNLFIDESVIITQGFIGKTLKGDDTTLGREGSDFTAAIFANILHAESVTIWKDVNGVMNADPKKVKDTVPVSHLNYKEVIEMAYYGAQVIHPKTIKPLQNESIPLFVRCFLQPDLQGTVINGIAPEQLPPMIVFKKKQVLFSFQTSDFSFIEGKPSREIKNIFAAALVKGNLTQNTAISMLICIDENEDKQNRILSESKNFIVSVETGLTLLTIRHYTGEVIDTFTKGKQIILEQRTKDTLQVLFRE